MIQKSDTGDTAEAEVSSVRAWLSSVKKEMVLAL